MTSPRTGPRAPTEAIPVGARNPRLQRLRKLVRASKSRSEHGVFVVDGPVLVADALRSGLRVRELFATVGTAPLLADTPIGDDVDLYTVEDSVLTSVLDPVSPRPVAAVVDIPDRSIDDLPMDAPVLLAVEIRDPGNLGTMIRTAEAAGCGGLVVTGSSVDRWNPKVVRASAGSILRLPVVSMGDTGLAIERLRTDGRPVVSTVVDPVATCYDSADLSAAALVVGNEPHGLPDDVVAATDESVTIPMAAGVESLNVAAAAAVICFEAARQRRAGQAR